MQARISHLHRVEADWQKLKDWIPEAGELVIYDPDENHSYSRLKVGDGIRNLQALDFCFDSTMDAFLQKYRYLEIIDGGRITQQNQ